MNMAAIHIISDLFLGHNEFSRSEENIPDVDLIILNGNIGDLKRSMLFAETVCKKYPDAEVVVNRGFTERYHNFVPKFAEEPVEGMLYRQKLNPDWPKNLHFSLNPTHIKLRTGEIFNILCVFGFPRIHKISEDWMNSWYYRNIMMDVTLNQNDPRILKPKNSSNVCHGHFPVWASQEWINTNHEEEVLKIKYWETTPDHRKILVTHMNPYKDDRNLNLIVSPHLIHLDEGLWVTSNTKVEDVRFLGARLVSNPGRGELPRRHVIVI